MTTNNGIVEILTTHTVSVDSAEGGGFDYYRAWCYGCQCLIGDKSPAEHQAEMLTAKLAEIWDEGYRAGATDLDYGTKNPYGEGME